MQSRLVIELKKDNLLDKASETVWVDSVQDGLYRILNVPFLADTVALYDIVHAKVNDGKLVLTGVKSHSGHSVFRLYLKSSEPTHKTDDLLNDIQGLGCSFESFSSTVPLYAIDVPDDVLLTDVRKRLEEEERNGFIEFDEGFIAQ